VAIIHNDTAVSFCLIMPANEESSSQPPAIPAFNGGKMMHIFEFDETTKMYAPREASKDAAVALQHGRMFYKIDGSNGMIIRADGDTLLAFQRLDTRGRPIPERCTRLPSCHNVDTYKGHSYCYEPITANVTGKKEKKRNEAMLAVVEKHTDYLSSLGETVSIEWVGNKFNKTPGVPVDVAIAIHSEQVCEEIIDRSYEGMRSFFLEADLPTEGLILEFQGKYWKVRADCFDRKCRFKTHTSTARPPVYLS
jgi:hypothetical protein